MQHDQKQIYTCPMHPEIRQEGPGRCPKCGMDLVPVGESKPKVLQDKGLGTLTWKSYLPLITIFALLLLGTVAVSLKDYSSGSFSVSSAVTYFMAGFFLVFSGFKLMDLKGFASGYATYDLLAKKVFAWGYIYPFVELAFGLSMLVGYHPEWLLWVEFAVMAFSGLGVGIKLIRKEEFICACLGTFLKVPLTKITLIEDFGMALLALVLILI